MKIHHTQLKQAAALGGTLSASDNNPGIFIATKGEHTFLASSPKEALDKLIAAVGGKPKKVKAVKTPKTEEAAPGVPATEAKAPRKAKKKKAKKARKSSDEDDGEEGDEEESGKGSVVKAKYKKKYQPTHDTNGDEFTDAFRAATVNEAEDAVDPQKLGIVARENGLSLKPWLHLKNKDGGMNVGMIRMNLGNVMRGMWRNGTDIRIGDKVFKGQPKKEKVKKPAKPKAAKKGGE